MQIYFLSVIPTKAYILALNHEFACAYPGQNLDYFLPAKEHVLKRYGPLNVVLPPWSERTLVRPAPFMS